MPVFWESIEEESYAVPQEILFSRMVVALKNLIEEERSIFRSPGKSREFTAAVRRLLEGNRDVVSPDPAAAKLESG